MKNIWDKVKDFTTPYASDDDYDDYDDDMDDGFADEEPVSRRSARTERETRRETRPVTDNYDTDETDAYQSASFSAAPAASTTVGFNGHVVGGTYSSSRQQMVLVRPETFADATAIATSLREKRGIVLNLEGVDKALARRVVDFLSGCAYALDGNVKKVAVATYVFCPNNMEITGDLQNLTGDVEAYV